jgi:hypothetical protein
MLSKLVKFFDTHYVAWFVILCLVLIPIYFAFSGSVLVVSDKNIQNHLAWSIKGECFFVRPSDTSVKLIRLEDCDKK